MLASTSLRRKSKAPSGSLGESRASLNGSLMALYSPFSGKPPPSSSCQSGSSSSKTLNVLVLGTADIVSIGRIVDKLLDAWQTGPDHFADKNERRIEFDDTRGPRNVNFIEVDTNKNDLWTTLDADGFVVLFSVSRSNSFKDAIQTTGYISNQRGAGVPLWLVGVTPDPANTTVFSQRHISHNEAKTFAKQNHLEYLEVAEEGRTKRSPFAYSQLISKIVASLAESSEDVLGDAVNEKKIKFDFQEQTKRKKSRSCDDISLLLRSERFF